MTIQFETPEFHASVAEVRAASASLVATRSRAAEEVATLLDTWHGAASTAFAEAWTDWLRSSSTVASALADLADALAMFQTDMHHVDAGSGASLAALEQRLS